MLNSIYKALYQKKKKKDIWAYGSKCVVKSRGKTLEDHPSIAAKDFHSPKPLSTGFCHKNRVTEYSQDTVKARCVKY
jgi:hypothetical protein